MAEYTAKRKTPRRTLERRVGVLYRGGYETASSLEIGEGGMMVYGIDAIPIESSVVLSFSLPEEIIISVQATVRYELEGHRGLDGLSLGFEFVNLPLDYQRKIRTFVAAKSLRESQRDQRNLRAVKQLHRAA